MKTKTTTLLRSTGSALALLAGSIALWLPADDAHAENISVYKSPTCGCCKGHSL